MAPNDPAHVSAVLSSLHGWCGPPCSITVADRAPRSGGVAFRVSRGTSTCWLQAKHGRPDRFGGIVYVVRNDKGADLGPIPHWRDCNRLSEAADHLSAHLAQAETLARRAAR